MTTINLADATIYVNDVNNPTDGEKLRTDLNTIITEENAKDTRLANLESGTMTIAGQKTFSTNPLLANSTPSNSLEAASKGYVDNSVINTRGLKPSWASNNTITIAPGVCRNHDNTVIFNSTVTLTLDISTSGAGGLDNGAEASNTTYYVYLIAKTDGTVNGVFSVQNANAGGSITMPSGYTYYKQLPVFVRNNGSTNIEPFDMLTWNPGFGNELRWRGALTIVFSGTSAGAQNIVNGLTTAPWNTVSAANWMSAISRYGYFNVLGSGSTDVVWTRTSSGVANTTETWFGTHQIWLATTSSQQIDWGRQSGSGNVYIDVMGCKITEVAL